MKTNINLDLTKNTAYLLFGWQAIEARPNLDPYEGNLRKIEETGQVYTSDVHIKHHTRRGIKAAAELDFKEFLKEISAEVFYEKKGENGKSRSMATRVEALQAKTAEEIFQTCLDLPLFGFVYAKPKEEKGKDEKKIKLPGESWQKNGATNTILRPATFHEAQINYLGRNNAFTGQDDSGKDKEASGSAISDVLDYGFFLALFEINIPALQENIRNHKFAPGDVNTWISLLAAGLWRAYTTHRFSSITQRGQYANFLLAWSPNQPENIQPTTLREIAYTETPVTNIKEAIPALKSVLPKFLEDWQYTKEKEAGRIDPNKTLEKTLN